MAIFRQYILILILLTISIFFFTGGPDQYSPRSYQSFWNLGHILFFSLFPLIFLPFQRISNNFLIHCILALAVTIIMGAAIEFMQYGSDQRKPDVGDFFRNIIGAMAGIFFFLPFRKRISKKILSLMQWVTIVLIGFQILPVIVSLTDEYLARNQFPVLSGYETPFEVQRWWATTDLRRSVSIKKTGKASMRVTLDTRKYAGTELRYFPRNWESYRFFQFSVYNPSSDAILIICRIHDDDPRETGIRYEDRFKRRYRIPKGWHTINVKLEDVKHAPKNRLMNMQKIMNVSFFTLGIPYQRIIYIDDVKLI